MQRQLTVPLAAPQPGGKVARAVVQQRRRTIAIQPVGSAPGGVSSDSSHAAAVSAAVSSFTKAATSPRLQAASASGAKMERHGSVVNRSYRIVDPFAPSGTQSFTIPATGTQKGLAVLARKRPAFVSNAIRTSKYSYLSFLPVCLLQEFRRVSRCML